MCFNLKQNLFLARHELQKTCAPAEQKLTENFCGARDKMISVKVNSSKFTTNLQKTFGTKNAYAKKKCIKNFWHKNAYFLAGIVL